MLMKINFVTIYVRDEDEALDWYTNVLGYEKRADMTSPLNGMRWLAVAPPQQTEIQVVLQAPNPAYHGAERAAALTELIGKGTPTVLESDDIQADYDCLQRKGVQFTGPIESLPWGRSAMFFDLYGNLYNLVQDVAR
jgi:catechol 2,3-dioxygenase-like lactoylglutathione lyase family enzyme